MVFWSMLRHVNDVAVSDKYFSDAMTNIIVSDGDVKEVLYDSDV